MKHTSNRVVSVVTYATHKVFLQSGWYTVQDLEDALEYIKICKEKQTKDLKRTLDKLRLDEKKEEQ